MRIEKTNLLLSDIRIAQRNFSVSPELSGEDKRMKDSIVENKDPANSTRSTDYRQDGSNRKIEYFIHEKTGDIMIKVYDAETNEIVREIPPEKIKDIIANILERAGLLVDE